MKTSCFWVFIACAVCCNYTYAQQYPKHSIGMGILAGAGSFQNNTDKTLGLGIKADYQRNLAPLFSLRFETAFLHNFQGSDLRLYQTGEFTEYKSQPNALSASISPLLYGRNERFNFFIGAQIGSALVWNKQSLTSATLVNNNFVINVEEYPTQRDLTFGVNPIVGINFSTGNEKTHVGEFEIAFTMHRWLEKFYVFQDKPLYREIDYRFLHAQLTYRFILK